MVMGDERGKLISLEGNKTVPFEIKRVYWIFDTLPDQSRDMHAHKNMEQIIVVIDGACQFVLDDGKKREKIWLNRPDIALIGAGSIVTKNVPDNVIIKGTY